ncbi:MAG: RNA-binding domain-containing protein [Nitrosopumilus sp.]|uniref:RNA-binding domain-containing protein n=1 Tax=Nitrosopumilus sp. TaxID=2024843 RepID=UPI00292E7446|nr:RNA-binding domain-containing protein [Nitrosopumilus sp.]
MASKLEVTIDIIVHATEDISKILQPFKELFELDEENFTLQETTGHFENPIILLKAQIEKKYAQKFMEKMLKLLSSQQVDDLIEEIEERTVDSRFHMRLDKQELIRGKVIVKESDTIKLKIHTPIYNKKDTVRLFTKIFQIAN